MADKVNASWYRMAMEYGLFSKERELLLAVDFARPEDQDTDGEHRGCALTEADGVTAGHTGEQVQTPT
ncbi:hypothetical protein ACGFY3_04450 [Streptomyces mirabilis]|uniref:hypothetical protein n=1 Tax=Streptomyces mirabilis TaxID=68239 RepID=UPI0037120377